MNTKLCILLIVCSIFCSGNHLFAQNVPVVQNAQNVQKQLYFPKSNVVVPLHGTDVYKIFQIRERVVLIRREQVAPYAAGGYFVYIISFFDFEGHKICYSAVITGGYEFFFDEAQNRIIAAQMIQSSEETESYFFDFEGKVVQTIVHDYSNKEVGMTPDNKYIWFVATKSRPVREDEVRRYPTEDYRPYSHVLFFDVVNGNLQKEYSVDGTELEAKIGKDVYRINFPPATW